MWAFCLFLNRGVSFRFIVLNSLGSMKLPSICISLWLWSSGEDCYLVNTSGKLASFLTVIVSSGFYLVFWEPKSFLELLRVTMRRRLLLLVVRVSSSRSLLFSGLKMLRRIDGVNLLIRGSVSYLWTSVTSMVLWIESLVRLSNFKCNYLTWLSGPWVTSKRLVDGVAKGSSSSNAFKVSYFSNWSL